MPESDKRVRLTVVPDKCQGHNRCHVLAPELIEIDELGFAHAKGDGVVIDSLKEKARLAVRNCPEFALRLSSGDEGEAS